MAIDLYIIGTSHALQCGSAECTASDVQGFETELRKLCVALKVRRIAEEMTEDGLTSHKVKETVGQRVAKGTSVSYQTVDLSVKERQALSIDDSVLFATLGRRQIFEDAFQGAFDDLVGDIRERIWIARLLSGEDWPTLFICGSDHAVSMRRLWCRLGMEAKVIHRDYVP